MLLSIAAVKLKGCLNLISRFFNKRSIGKSKRPIDLSCFQSNTFKRSAIKIRDSKKNIRIERLLLKQKFLKLNCQAKLTKILLVSFLYRSCCYLAWKVSFYETEKLCLSTRIQVLVFDVSTKSWDSRGLTTLPLLSESLVMLVTQSTEP